MVNTKYNAAYITLAADMHTINAITANITLAIFTIANMYLSSLLILPYPPIYVVYLFFTEVISFIQLFIYI